MKKILAATIVLSLAITIGAIAEQPKELTVWFMKSFSDEANARIEERVNEFGKKHDVKINFEPIAATDYMLKLNAAVEAKTVPDVTLSNLYTILNYYPNNPYQEVTKIVDEVHGQRKFFDSVINATKIENQNFFVPFNASSTLLFVRKDLLEAKQLPVPTTWDEVFDVALKVSEPDKGIYGLGMGCGPMDEDAENTFRMIMWSNGGAIFDEVGQPIIENNEPTRRVVETYLELFNKQAVPPSSPSWDPGGNNKSYLMGESAMVFNAPTLYRALQNDPAYADILANTLCLAPPAGSSSTTTIGFTQGWSIMKDSKNQELAAELIRTFYDVEWYNNYVATIAPVFAPVFEDSAKLPLYADGVNAEILRYVQSANGYYGYAANTIKGMAVGAKYYFTYPVAKMLNSVVNGVSIDDAFSTMTMDIEDILVAVK